MIVSNLSSIQIQSINGEVSVAAIVLCGIFRGLRDRRALADFW